MQHCVCGGGGGMSAGGCTSMSNSVLGTSNVVVLALIDVPVIYAPPGWLSNMFPY